MLTYEDVTAFFMKAAADTGLSTHPEYWTNTRTLEREFACVCHVGTCEEAEQRGNCTLSFTWSTLDTALSLEGPSGVCDFFHEPGEDCPHLHTREVPPLLIELSYNLTLNSSEAAAPEKTLLSLAQMLKLQASEHSSRTIETRPGMTMTLKDNRLQPESLTLQQRVEIPIWHPEGMEGLAEFRESHEERAERARRRRPDDDDDIDLGIERQDELTPEEWLPRVLIEVCQDIAHVLNALDGVRSHGLLNRE